MFESANPKGSQIKLYKILRMYCLNLSEMRCNVLENTHTYKRTSLGISENTVILVYIPTTRSIMNSLRVFGQTKTFSVISIFSK